MSDLYNELLQKSIDRQARKIISNGATEKDRYGNLLDSVRGRDLKQEEADRKNAMISNLANNIGAMREQRERESEEHLKELSRTMNDMRTRERKAVDDFLNRNKKYLGKAEETIRKEQSKMYFS